MVKIRMRQWALGAPDRVHVQEYEQGQVYEVPDFLAKFFETCGYLDTFYDPVWEAQQLEQQRIQKEAMENFLKIQEEEKQKQAKYYEDLFNAGLKNGSSSVGYLSFDDPYAEENTYDLIEYIDVRYLEYLRPNSRAYIEAFEQYQVGKMYRGREIIDVDTRCFENGSGKLILTLRHPKVSLDRYVDKILESDCERDAKWIEESYKKKYPGS